MAIQTNGIVIRNERIKPLYFLLEIHSPPIATEIKPGQFIMVKTSDNNDPFLRRPFSIYKNYSADHERKTKKGNILIIYKKVGKGTKKMAEFISGRKVDLIGPLGNGFTFPPLPFLGKIILIGGGAGIVSLYLVAETLKTCELFVFIGGKTRDDILCIEDFKKLGANLSVSTEDGSLGFKGTVLDLFLSRKEKYARNRTLYLYSCGPLPMLAELGKMSKIREMICQVSLETRMGCGFGACWGCVVKTNDIKRPYQRVCKEGPVFNLEDIDWKNEYFSKP